MKDLANKVMQQQEERRRVEALLVSAQQGRWFGTITIQFKEGVIDLVRREETLKLSSEEWTEPPLTCSKGRG